MTLHVMAVPVSSVSGSHICGRCPAPATIAVLLHGQPWSDMCRQHALAEINVARRLLGLPELPRRSAARILPRKRTDTT